MNDIQVSSVILGVAGTSVMFLLGIVGRFVWQKFTKIDEVAKEQNAIKFNYLQRFDEVKTLVSAENEKTRKQISDLHLDLARNYVRKNECANAHAGGQVFEGAS